MEELFLYLKPCDKDAGTLLVHSKRNEGEHSKEKKPSKKTASFLFIRGFTLSETSNKHLFLMVTNFIYSNLKYFLK